MRIVARSMHFWIGIGLFAAFCASAPLMPVQTTLLITNCLLLVGSLAVGLCYAPTAWRAIRNDRSPEIQHIALGIAYAWLFSGAWRVWSILWLTGGQEAWMVNNDVVAVFQAGIFLGACYHLTSPGAAASTMRGRTLAVIAVVAAALALAAFLIFFRPDSSGILNAIKPFVPR